jgi:hypothetical protein
MDLQFNKADCKSGCTGVKSRSKTQLVHSKFRSSAPFYRFCWKDLLFSVFSLSLQLSFHGTDKGTVIVGWEQLEHSGISCRNK